MLNFSLLIRSADGFWGQPRGSSQRRGGICGGAGQMAGEQQPSSRLE
jgi:hypothetical protein